MFCDWDDNNCNDNNTNNNNDNKNNNIDFWKKTRSMNGIGKLQKMWKMLQYVWGKKISQVTPRASYQWIELNSQSFAHEPFCFLINHTILQRFIYWLFLWPAGQLYVYVYIEVTQLCDGYVNKCKQLSAYLVLWVLLEMKYNLQLNQWRSML